MARAVLPAELWTLSRGKDAAQCFVTKHPRGVEVRYVINRHPLVTHVFDTWEAVADQAREWRNRLESRGWGGSPEAH